MKRKFGTEYLKDADDVACLISIVYSVGGSDSKGHLWSQAGICNQSTELHPAISENTQAQRELVNLLRY